MAEIDPPAQGAPEAPAASGPARSKEEIALELMRFVVQQTGFGRSSQQSAGFSGKPAGRSAEEQTEALLDLFQRCRKVLNG
jgi:hypothetical protein